MIAIIPVAGAGTKLRPHTYTQPKALIPLAGRPILSIIIDQLQEAGIEEFVFIIGYLGNKIEDYVKETYPQLKSSFVMQNDRKGTGHAIELTKELVGNRQIMIVLGDTIAEYDIDAMITSPYSMLAVKKVDDPRGFGVAEVIEDSLFIEKLVEKPAIPKSNLALVGVYKIIESALLFDCLLEVQAIKEDINEPFSITDALDCMIQKGAKFQIIKVKSWFDCGKKDTLLASNATMLRKFGGNVDKENNYKNTVIVPPVHIGTGCIIKNAILGPNVAIGDHATITEAIIQNSIIGAYSNLQEVVLSNSIIGSDAEVRGEKRSLSIGDNTAIDLGGNTD